MRICSEKLHKIQELGIAQGKQNIFCKSFANGKFEYDRYINNKYAFKSFAKKIPINNVFYAENQLLEEKNHISFST